LEAPEFTEVKKVIATEITTTTETTIIRIAVIGFGYLTLLQGHAIACPYRIRTAI
jgi:hypothetical protein